MTGLAVTSRSGAVLKTPIAREDWELKNDDVQLVEKIGRGNFGDVYKGGFISKSFLTFKVVCSKMCQITILNFFRFTVKLDDKERFDKEQIGVKEPFPVTNCQFTS